MELEDRVAIVTGAGSGIGHAIAEALAEAGAAVVIDYLDFEEEAHALAARLPRAVAVHGDVSVRSDVERVVETAVREFGGVDCLVSNAGISRRRPFLELSDGDFWRTLQVNLGGVFLCSQVAGRVMAARGGAAIVNISSIHEDTTFPESAAYCASKGGIRRGLTRHTAGSTTSSGAGGGAVIGDVTPCRRASISGCPVRLPR